MLLTLFRSLRFRLISSVVMIEIVMLSLLVWSNMGVIQTAHADRLKDTATSMLQQIAKTSGSYLLEVDYASLEEYLRNIANHEELEYLSVVDRDRHPVVTLGELPVEPWPARDEHPINVHDGVLDVAEQIEIGGQSMGEVRMGFSLALMERAIQAARIRSIAIATTEIILTVIVTVFIGVHLTRRLGRLAGAAQRVGAGDYSVAVESEVPDEVGMTALAFNQMVSEVSERTKRLEETLARERVIEKTSIDGMMTYGAEERIRSLNPAMSSLFGYSEKELLGKPVSLLLEPDRNTPSVWGTQTGTRREVVGLRKDGSRFPLELYIGRVDINAEPLFAATLHDITERKRAENECKTLLQGNRFLIHKSLAVQEEERRHLARELHDELGQCMTAIQADAELIHELSKTSNPKIETSASAILNVSARIYGVVHSMMQRLRPGVLDDLGLVAAIEEEVDAWRSRHPSVRVSLDTAPDLPSLGESSNISLYRIVQESLTNIAKHANATEVTITLEAADNSGNPVVTLEITDNGKGLQSDLRSRGLGLIGMRERVEALNGRFEVLSNPGRGVTIRAEVPANEETAQSPVVEV
jgi:two-component system sensor histidine kinase UhpB